MFLDVFIYLRDKVQTGGAEGKEESFKQTPHRGQSLRWSMISGPRDHD